MPDYLTRKLQPAEAIAAEIVTWLREAGYHEAAGALGVSIMTNWWWNPDLERLRAGADSEAVVRAFENALRGVRFSALQLERIIELAELHTEEATDG